jgi:hypothetical protein
MWIRQASSPTHRYGGSSTACRLICGVGRQPPSTDDQTVTDVKTRLLSFPQVVEKCKPMATQLFGVPRAAGRKAGRTPSNPLSAGGRGLYNKSPRWHNNFSASVGCFPRIKERYADTPRLVVCQLVASAIRAGTFRVIRGAAKCG